MMEIRKVQTDNEVKIIATLASEIWTAHYIPIIGREQIRYMLNKFQSRSAIRDQISRGYEYYILFKNSRPTGYFALVPCPAEFSLQLSKIYLRHEQRGQGGGKAMLEFSENRCRELNLRKLWLTVNRHNLDSIAFYRHMGFIRTGEVLQDIGNGFVMDDYKMVKRIIPMKSKPVSRKGSGKK